MDRPKNRRVVSLAVAVAAALAAAGCRDGARASGGSSDFCTWLEENGDRAADIFRGDDPALQPALEEAQELDPPAEIAEAWLVLVSVWTDDPDIDAPPPREEPVDQLDESLGELEEGLDRVNERLEQLAEAADQIDAYVRDECGITHWWAE